MKKAVRGLIAVLVPTAVGHLLVRLGLWPFELGSDASMAAATILGVTGILLVSWLLRQVWP